jgi:hypothetical protein
VPPVRTNFQSISYLFFEFCLYFSPLKVKDQERDIAKYVEVVWLYYHSFSSIIVEEYGGNRLILWV